MLMNYAKSDFLLQDKTLISVLESKAAETVALDFP